MFFIIFEKNRVEITKIPEFNMLKYILIILQLQKITIAIFYNWVYILYDNSNNLQIFYRYEIVLIKSQQFGRQIIVQLLDWY